MHKIEKNWEQSIQIYVYKKRVKKYSFQHC